MKKTYCRGLDFRNRGHWRCYAVNNASRVFAGFVFARNMSEVRLKLKMMGFRGFRVYKLFLPVCFYVKNKKNVVRNTETMKRIHSHVAIKRRIRASQGRVREEVA